MRCPTKAPNLRGRGRTFLLWACGMGYWPDKFMKASLADGCRSVLRKGCLPYLSSPAEHGTKSINFESFERALPFLCTSITNRIVGGRKQKMYPEPYNNTFSPPYVAPKTSAFRRWSPCLLPLLSFLSALALRTSHAGIPPSAVRIPSFRGAKSTWRTQERLKICLYIWNNSWNKNKPVCGNSVFFLLHPE